MPNWQDIFAAMREEGVSIADDSNIRPVGGGDISAAWRVGDAFIKTGNSDALDMLEAEAEGLRELAAANAIRVPHVFACGVTGNDAYLAIEWIGFDRPTREAERRCGEQLAALHRNTKDRFGWHRGNTIGLTPQHNDWCDNWVEFFRQHRLEYQLQLAERNGFGGELQAIGVRLCENFDTLFRDYTPLPSLVHGDLWGGNWGATNGQPVIFDPAVYYGDRESDIAMTRLFGGFGPGFYSAYQENWPMEPGHEDRLKLYQLYHVLNHLNLFGGAYLDRAIQLIRHLNSRIEN
jgi:protein-ribulosamine 3-kinase